MRILLLFCFLAFGLTSTLTAQVVISEIRIDQPSTDNDEFFELENQGATDVVLDGYTYIVIGDGSGGSGVIENVTDLSGNTILAEDFFVVAESSFTLGTADLTTSLNFENSDNVTHLLVQGFTGSNGDDLDTDDDGVLDVTPWTSIVSGVGFVETTDGSGEVNYAAGLGLPEIGPDGNFVPGTIFIDASGTWQIGSFSDLSANTPGAPNDAAAPVELLSFTGEAQKLKVTLEWITASEDGSAFFLLERSTDGRNFAPFAEVDAAGNAVEMNYYNAEDAAPVVGTNYYRLVQYDLDGSSTTYNTVAVVVESVSGVFPNPSTGLFQLAASAGDQVKVFTTDGRIIRTQKVIADGLQTIDLQGLPNGAYRLVHATEKKLTNHTLVVRR